MKIGIELAIKTPVNEIEQAIKPHLYKYEEPHDPDDDAGDGDGCVGGGIGALFTLVA